MSRVDGGSWSVLWTSSRSWASSLNSGRSRCNSKSARKRYCETRYWHLTGRFAGLGSATTFAPACSTLVASPLSGSALSLRTGSSWKKLQPASGTTRPAATARQSSRRRRARCGSGMGLLLVGQGRRTGAGLYPESRRDATRPLAVLPPLSPLGRGVGFLSPLSPPGRGEEEHYPRTRPRWRLRATLASVARATARHQLFQAPRPFTFHTKY